MSSFPTHVKNIKALKELGFDVNEYYEDNEVTLESWGYDEQVDILEMVITQLSKQERLLYAYSAFEKEVKECIPYSCYSLEDVVGKLEESKMEK